MIVPFDIACIILLHIYKEDLLLVYKMRQLSRSFYSAWSEIKKLKFADILIPPNKLKYVRLSNELTVIDIHQYSNIDKTFVNYDAFKYMLHPFLISVDFTHLHDNVSDDVVKLLSKCTSLISIKLNRCSNITNDAADYLSELPSLQSVDFYGCIGLTDLAAKYISKCALLESISFRQCNNLTNIAAVHISNCTNLKNICMSSPYLTDTSVKYISKCTQLISIDFFGCSNVSKNAFKCLSKCPNLEIVISNPMDQPEVRPIV